jgi:hypothetical protein
MNRRQSEGRDLLAAAERCPVMRMPSYTRFPTMPSSFEVG